MTLKRQSNKTLTFICDTVKSYQHSPKKKETKIVKPKDNVNFVK